MISESAYLYCKDDLSLIENYDKAVNDTTKNWVCHHRLEIDLGLTPKELIEKDMYFNVPASQLIFLTRSEHAKIHNANNSIGFRGKTFSKETRKKLIEAKLGTKLSEEHKTKIGDSLRGRKKPPFSEEHKRKLREAKRGKEPHNKGKRGILKWVNNDIESKMVNVNELEHYISLGYKIGRGKTYART